eukprot:8517426-Alexandrium_andersonii.AAC.1
MAAAKCHGHACRLSQACTYWKGWKFKRRSKFRRHMCTMIVIMAVCRYRRHAMVLTILMVM